MKACHQSSHRHQFIRNFPRMRILNISCLLLLTYLVNEASSTTEDPVPYPLLVKLKRQPLYDTREERKQFVDAMFNQASFQTTFFYFKIGF